jgi:hypothetical protein
VAQHFLLSAAARILSLVVFASPRVTGGEYPRINGASLLSQGLLMAWRDGY